VKKKLPNAKQGGPSVRKPTSHSNKTPSAVIGPYGGTGELPKLSVILIVCDNGPIKSLNAAQKRIEKTSNLLRISRIPALAHLLLFSKKQCWAATLL